MDDDTISNFMAITGATTEKATQYLQVADFNFEQAVNLYLETDGGLQLEAQDSASAEVRSPTEDNLEQIGTIADALQSRATEMEDFHDAEEFLDTSFRRSGDLQQRIAAYDPTSLRSMHDFLAGGMTGIPMPLRQTNRPVAIGDGEEDEQGMRLARLFSPPYEIMFRGSFFDARDTANNEQKWLIVTLHDPQIFQCQVMNRDLWKNSAIMELIKSSCIFQQFVVETPEALAYRNFYPVDSIPHIAIIDPRTGERVKVWSHAPDVSEFSVDLADFLESNSLYKFTAAKSKTEHVDLTEDEQVELAMALSNDEKSTKAKPDEVVIIDSNAPSPSKSAPTAAHISLSIPAKEHENPPADKPSTSIQFRFPDGQKIVKKFLKSDMVRALFEHLKAVREDLKTKPFEIMFHRDQLSAKLSSTLEELSIVSAMLNVDLV